MAAFSPGDPTVLRYLYSPMNGGFVHEIKFRTVIGPYVLGSVQPSVPQPDDVAARSNAPAFTLLSAKYDSGAFVDYGDLLGCCRGGIVVPGIDSRSGEHVAIKIVEENAVAQEDALTNPGDHRLLNEVRNECAINQHITQMMAGPLADHPGARHICKCFGVTKDLECNCLVFVQELCRDGDLLTFVNKLRQSRKALSHDHLGALREQLCLAISFLHSARVAHRDLSLENIMLVPSPVVGQLPELKIIDFGQSIMCTQPLVPLRVGYWNHGKRASISPEVTAINMAPEPSEGEPQVQLVDEFKADIWSAGACMYMLAYLDLPYNVALDGDHKFDRLMDLQFPDVPVYPAAFIVLLSAIFNRDPAARPSIDELSGVA